MYRAEIHNIITGASRREVDQLIFDVWSAESSKGHDVEILVPPGTSVLDPLDSVSTHVLVRNSENKLVGYGRVAIVFEPEALGSALDEVGSNLSFPLAYISRLVVHPDYQGLGIAQRIHNERINIARAHNIQNIYGWAVGEKPRSALAKAGFTEVKNRRGFATAWYKTPRTTRLVHLRLDTPPGLTARNLSRASH